MGSGGYAGATLQLHVGGVAFVIVGGGAGSRDVGLGRLEQVLQARTAADVPVGRVARLDDQDAQRRIVLALGEPDLPVFGTQAVAQRAVAPAARGAGQR